MKQEALIKKSSAHKEAFDPVRGKKEGGTRRIASLSPSGGGGNASFAPPVKKTERRT